MPFLKDLPKEASLNTPSLRVDIDSAGTVGQAIGQGIESGTRLFRHIQDERARGRITDASKDLRQQYTEFVSQAETLVDQDGQIKNPTTGKTETYLNYVNNKFDALKKDVKKRHSIGFKEHETMFNGNVNGFELASKKAAAEKYTSAVKSGVEERRNNKISEIHDTVVEGSFTMQDLGNRIINVNADIDRQVGVVYNVNEANEIKRQTTDKVFTKIFDTMLVNGNLSQAADMIRAMGSRDKTILQDSKGVGKDTMMLSKDVLNSISLETKSSIMVKYKKAKASQEAKADAHQAIALKGLVDNGVNGITNVYTHGVKNGHINKVFEANEIRFAANMADPKKAKKINDTKIKQSHKDYFTAHALGNMSTELGGSLLSASLQTKNRAKENNLLPAVRRVIRATLKKSPSAQYIIKKEYGGDYLAYEEEILSDVNQKVTQQISNSGNFNDGSLKPAYMSQNVLKTMAESEAYASEMENFLGGVQKTFPKNHTLVRNWSQSTKDGFTKNFFEKLKTPNFGMIARLKTWSTQDPTSFHANMKAMSDSGMKQVTNEMAYIMYTEPGNTVLGLTDSEVNEQLKSYLRLDDTKDLHEDIITRLNKTHAGFFTFNNHTTREAVAIGSERSGADPDAIKGALYRDILYYQKTGKDVDAAIKEVGKNFYAPKIKGFFTSIGGQNIQNGEVYNLRLFKDAPERSKAIIDRFNNTPLGESYNLLKKNGQPLPEISDKALESMRSHAINKSKHPEATAKEVVTITRQELMDGDTYVRQSVDGTRLEIYNKSHNIPIQYMENGVLKTLSFNPSLIPTSSKLMESYKNQQKLREIGEIEAGKFIKKLNQGGDPTQGR